LPVSLKKLRRREVAEDVDRGTQAF
jgi:hypothetical protein